MPDSPNLPEQALIERYLDALWMERGLSRNTLDAYRRDLETCRDWLTAGGGCLQRAQSGDVQRRRSNRRGRRAAAA